MIYGLIGEKLGHSYSREIHQELGMKSYELYELEPGQVEDFVKRPAVSGLNVTIPYKQTVMPFCDTLSESAKTIGCVNTLVRDGAGKLHGYNTDYDGFIYMLRRAGIDPRGRKVLILGTGGTSLTARAAIRDLGAGEIVIASRRAGKEETEGDGDGGCIVRFASYQDLAALHGDSEIIVNTTPVGMYPNAPDSLISLADFPDCQGVADVIYNPRLTGLLHQAAEKGVPYTDGLPMLVAQAKAAEELFTGRPIADEELERIIGTLRNARENIVIVGMPGSGKTSVGMAAAKKLGREFVDIDRVVEEREGRAIPEIFREDGEAVFRAMESAVIAEQGKRTGIVIATGGGAVLSEANYLPLKQNGRIFQITRSLDQLSTDGRPLSDRNTLKEMYEQRRSCYRRFADEIIENDAAVEEAALRLIAAFQGTRE